MAPPLSHCTIWGISLQALAFFLASANQGGSSGPRAAGDADSMGRFPSLSEDAEFEISREHGAVGGRPVSVKK